jgi:Ecdysteroid kinase-like family
MPQASFYITRRYNCHGNKSWILILFYFFLQQKLDYTNFNMHLFQNPVLADVMFDQGLEAFIDVAKEWKEYEKYIPYLEKYKKKYLSKAMKSYTPNRNGFGFNVLNHADFHLKNMMFRKSADGVIDNFYFVSFFQFNFNVYIQ